MKDSSIIQKQDMIFLLDILSYKAAYIHVIPFHSITWKISNQVTILDDKEDSFISCV